MVTPYKTQPKKKNLLPDSPIDQFKQPDVTPSTLITPTPKVDISPGAQSPAPNVNKNSTGGVQVIRDETTGKLTGVIKPDGTTLFGISPKEVNFLARKYQGEITAPQGTTFADVKPLTKEEQFRQQILDEQLKENIKSSMQPVNVTSEQLAQVGQTPTVTDNYNNPLTRNILQNQQSRETINKIPVLNLLGKISDSLISIGGEEFKSSINSNIDSLPKLKAYLNDYSNKDNFKAVKKTKSDAKERINWAIQLANQPGNSDLAIETYNNALNELNRNAVQLKILSQDQKAYTDEVRLEMTDLETYMREVLPGKKLRMQNALIKPDPNYYDNSLNQVLMGGQ